MFNVRIESYQGKMRISCQEIKRMQLDSDFHCAASSLILVDFICVLWWTK
jgi:hypothetical protein